MVITADLECATLSQGGKAGAPSSPLHNWESRTYYEAKMG